LTKGELALTSALKVSRFCPRQMKLLHPDSGDMKVEGNSIFLAGPTPRSVEVMPWRPVAIDILQDLGFKGTVFVPERKDWSVKFNYDDQVQWELNCLELASCIAFWVPRHLNDMLGLTTNVEFGLYIRSGKVVYGRPKNAPHTRYLDCLYEKWCGGREPHEWLRSLMCHAQCGADVQGTFDIN